MEVAEHVFYEGERFRIQTSGRYYQSGRKDAAERLLHRRIWLDNFGPIPEGMQIHHKDGNWRNNEISNLELVVSRDHQRKHMEQRMQVPEFREKAIEELRNNSEKAAKWHKSKHGIEWHKENGKQAWAGRKPSLSVCSVCGKEYETFFSSRSRFCSHSCEQKESYQRYKTAIGVCLQCGKEYVFNKYRRQECCSRQCAIKLRAERSKSIQSDAG